MKRFDEARREIERCVEIDPLSPLEVSEAVRLYVDRGDARKAEQIGARLLDTAPDSRVTLWGLGQLHLATGKLDEAIDSLERAVRTTNRDRATLPVLGNAYVRAGRPGDARKVLARLLETPEIAPGAIAHVYAGLDDKEQAIRWWWKAYEARDPRLVWLNVWDVDSRLLGHEPRFQELVRPMNFPR
jgi:tetratricopeptide (TPR) repeat protein